MTALYDNLGTNRQAVLDLPFREGVGIITQDVAKPHHPVSLVNTPTWESIASGLGVLALNGTTEYLESDSGDTGDLNFTSGDFTLAAWLRWESGEDSQIVMGRYAISIDGWELYLYAPTTLLTLRMHHATGAALRTAVYSDGWSQDTWHQMFVVRSGTSATFYRNGVALTTAGDVLEDPDTATRDLVIGARYTKDTNFFNGKLWRSRAWDRALSAEEVRVLYDREKRWFA